MKSIRWFSGSIHSLTKSIESYAKIPSPTAVVPDVTTFLNRIGRNTIQYEKNFESWDQLMNASSESMRTMGIETRDRRYILNWCEKFRQGEQLIEFKRGQKKWGGERNRKTNRAVHYGRLRAEAKQQQQN